MRELEWIASSLDDLRRFPSAVKKNIGVTLFRVQLGDTPNTVKPLRGLTGVYEIRTDFKSDTFRAVYATKIGTRLYVLHAFQKKSKSGISTPPRDMEVIRARLKLAREFAKEDDK